MNTEMNPENPILIVDDDESILLSIDTTLQMEGWDNVITCSDSRKAMGLIRDKNVELLLLDLDMPHIGGEELLAMVKEYVDIPVIIVTGAVDVKTAVRCIKAGAYDYIMKPVEEDQLLSAVARAVSYYNVKKENVALKQNYLSDFNGTLENPEAFKEIITANKKMLLIFQYIESVAKSSQPVFVKGETGVGKELVANVLHNLSTLSGDIVAVNAAGLDDNVFSDTLFGHVKGAFTGADQHRSGLIEKAVGGTLFLDEIGDLSLASQVKLLRLLQEGEYLPLGGDIPKHADVRIVAATNQDLAKLQAQGLFRKDLNYRLYTHRVQIPPLRERMDDIPLLVNHFLNQSASELGKEKPALNKELLSVLNTYSFPGNIRELQAMIYDAMTRHKSGVLSLDSFKHHIVREQTTGGASSRVFSDDDFPIFFSHSLPTMKQAGQLLVDEAMKRTSGNQSAAAKLLGISQQALSKRLKKQRMEDKDSQ